MTDQPAPEPTTEKVESSTLRRAISASAMGNMTEWFDYGVYTYATTYIPAFFGPRGDCTIVGGCVLTWVA